MTVNHDDIPESELRAFDGKLTRIRNIEYTVNPKPQLELNEWHEYIKKENERLAFMKKN